MTRSIQALPGWLDEYLQAPGASSLAALIAAVVAFIGVMVTLTAESRRRRAEYQIEAVVEAIKELNTSVHAIRQRHLAYRPGSTATVERRAERRAERRDTATSRNATLPAAKARLKVVNLRTDGFVKAHNAINTFSGLSWKATNPDGPPDTSIIDDDVWAQMEIATAAVEAFSDDVTNQIHKKRRRRRAAIGLVAVEVSPS